MSAEPAQTTTAVPTTPRMPDFFIVGHHKSGTTAMYEMLRRHPDIYMPDMKEPEFFGRAHRTDLEPMAVRRPRTYAESRPQTQAEYLSLFASAPADRIIGEASPSYLWSATAAGEIARAQPEARIIAILREPASFLHSLHLQMLRNHVQTEPDLAKAIAREGTANGGGRVIHYTDRIRYVEQVRRYHAVFPAERVLVLIYDDFRTENHATMRRVLEFLGAEGEAPIEALEANPTIAVRSRRLDGWVRTVRAGRGPLSGAAKSSFKALIPTGLRRDLVRGFQRNVVYGSAPPPDARLMGELRRRFKPEVVELSDYLDRDLVSLWGYDGIS